MSTRSSATTSERIVGAAGPIGSVAHPVMSIPLHSVIKPQIAIMLQQLLGLHTVGAFLNAWRDDEMQRHIEQLFDSPAQARQAITVCATWVGLRARPVQDLPGCWWNS